MKRAMSVVLAAALLLGTNGPASAIGAVEAGIKGGVNFANQSVDPSDLEPDNSRTGLALGGYVGIPVMPSFKIQPEALFMMKGDAGSNEDTYKLNYVEVPVLAKIGFLSQSPAHPSLFAGPSVAFNTTAKADAAGTEVDLKDATNTVDFGLVVGGGVDFSKVGIDVRYSRGLSNVAKDSGDTTVNNSVISLMGTFRFL